MMLSNEFKTLCDFYLHGQNFVYIPIFLLLVLHVFKRNNWHVSWFKKKIEIAFSGIHSCSSLFQFSSFVFIKLYKVIPIIYNYNLLAWGPPALMSFALFHGHNFFFSETWIPECCCLKDYIQ